MEDVRCHHCLGLICRFTCIMVINVYIVCMLLVELPFCKKCSFIRLFFTRVTEKCRVAAAKWLMPTSTVHDAHWRQSRESSKSCCSTINRGSAYREEHTLIHINVTVGIWTGNRLSRSAMSLHREDTLVVWLLEAVRCHQYCINSQVDVYNNH